MSDGKRLFRAFRLAGLNLILFTSTNANADLIGPNVDAFLFGRTESWTEDALLHDGRIIEVKRKVDLVPFQGELSQYLTRFPSTYRLMFKHPDTGRTIEWKGESHFEPIRLDVVKGSPYLVVLGEPNLSNMQKYGCPDIPYIFLRYDEKTRNWIPIQRDQIPIELKEANIAVS